MRRKFLPTLFRCERTLGFRPGVRATWQKEQKYLADSKPACDIGAWALARVFLLLVSLMTMYPVSVYADNLGSTNYTLVDPEIASNSGTTSSANYQSLELAGTGIEMGQLSSSLYKIGSGQGYTFMANVPKITCFETTTTSGTTECVSLSRGNGMVGECGLSGCYDRAMVQIDTQSNPTDTVYSIQLSSDNWATVYVVDGTTRTLKALTSKAIGDYKTKTQWESSPWTHYTVIGLRPDTEYKARATALQGDFTETPPGPSKTATTTLPSVSFDLDIGADFTADTNAPYAVSLGILTPETEKFQTTQRVKTDISTNAQNGISIYAQDSFSGIRSNSSSYTLSSAAEDLSLPASGDGFGMQESGTTQDAASEGYVVPGADYDVTGTNVGALSSSSAVRILCTLLSSSGTCGVNTPTWVNGGKALYTFGARASLNAPAKSDYTDTLTFTVVGGW